MRSLLLRPLVCGIVLGLASLCEAQTKDLPTAPVAQGSSLPSAPVPDGPNAPAKPLLVVPKATYAVPEKGNVAKKPTEACDGPADAGYQQEGPPVSPEMKGQLQNYMQLVLTEVGERWIRTMPRAQKNAWIKSRKLMVRFTVMPDGTYKAPMVTVSSGRADEDQHALDAIRSHASFPLPPPGFNRPVPMCVMFMYNPGVRENVDPMWNDKREKKL